MTENAAEGGRSLAPHTWSGWVATVLGFGVLAVIGLLFVLSDNITNGGSTSLPVWMRLVTIGGILLIAVPAILVGLKTRRTDPSILGTIALVIASVLGVWITLTGVASLFLE